MPRRKGGFRSASVLIAERLRKAGETRGFAVARLLTHWAEIVGPDIAAAARPVNIGYRRAGLGATLTLLTTGAAAPVVQMQLPRIRERVNACYGYNAIARIALTQTAPEGFGAGFGAGFGPGLAEGQAGFDHDAAGAGAHAAVRPARQHDPELGARAQSAAAGVRDEGLRAALETLARNVLSKGGTGKEGFHG